MFGVVHACRGTLGDELFAQWQAHLCGLCLSLRDSRGQLSRAVTNTDAVMLSVLVEAQQGVAARTGAGPCPLRGMRSAAVVPAGAVAARLGATASLTLAAAKAGDVIAERRNGLAGSALVARTAGLVAGPLRRGALADRAMAEAVGAEGLLAALALQGEIESGVRPGDPISTVTAPASRAAGQIFAAAASVAGRPENAEPMRGVGEAFGALAHLLDAVEDLEADRRSGSFNPIIATGTSMAAVRRESAALVRRIRHGFDRLVLTGGRLARALLVDGTHAALHRAFGEPRDEACATTPSTVHLGYPGPQPRRPEPATPGYVPGYSPDYPPGQTPDYPPGYPPGPFPADPVDPGGPPPPPLPPTKPPFWSSVLPWIAVYCTGLACCASHTNPCTGKRHQAGCNNCDCDCCDACDACDLCGDGCCCDCGCDC